MNTKAQAAEIVLCFDRSQPAQYRYIFHMEEMDARRLEAEFDTEAAA